MKFGQVIQYNNINTFSKVDAENETERLVPDLFSFFKKALQELKEMVSSLVSITFDSPKLGKQFEENI